MGADLVTADPTIADGQRCRGAWATLPTPPATCSTAGRASSGRRCSSHGRSRPAVEGGFTIDDFVYDPAAGTLTCPAGLTRKVTTRRAGRFRRACRGCPLRDALHHLGHAAALVLLGEHDQLQREHRQRAAEEAFQATYRQHRPMVERSIAWLTRGNRRVPYRGIEKNNTWLHHRVAALNLRRLLAMGLTFDDGTWQPGLSSARRALDPATQDASGCQTTGREDPVVAP